MLTGISSAQSTAIDSLKRVLQGVKVDTAKVNTYNALAHEFRESNPDSTTYYAAKASTLSQQIKYNFGQANALMNNGNASVIRSNYPQALKDFNQAAKYFRLLL